ncbi:MAG: hypothetical protein WC061_09100, partial [Melioribacteraceae bacterium]
TVISLLLIGALLSCDAPRLNPLDPQNPDYQLSIIEGIVQTEAQPRLPLDGVKVYWKNDNILAVTDAAGKFFIDKLPQKQGWIYFEKDGYSRDSIALNLLNQKTQHVDARLNAIPRLDDLVIYTSILNRYPDVQSDSLFVKAKISDNEGDVVSVFVRCPELGINKTLSFNAASGYYENKFLPGDLDLQFIDEGIGKNFEISVYDPEGKEFKVGYSTIKRTIRQDITFRSPANLEIVEFPVKFVWGRFLPGFNFTYMFEIYTNENSPVRKKQVTGISKEEVEIIANIGTFNLDDLPPGQYFWVIWVVDDFQNRARSRQASFVIQ